MIIEIGNSDIANLLKQQAKKRNITIGEYISSLVLQDIDLKKVKKEIDSVKEEFLAYKQGNIKLEDANDILREL